MQIGIIGSGNVGGSLGKALAAQGHSVMFGSRDPHSEKIQALLSATGGQAGSVAEAVEFGAVIALTTPWGGAEEAIQQGDWSGKIVIDAMNRFGKYEHSVAEDLAQMIPEAQVVKAFNTIGAEHLVNPLINGQRASMFICGDDAQAKQVVGQLVSELGFDLVDAGGLDKAILLEKLAELWVSLMRGGMGRNMAFKLLVG